MTDTPIDTVKEFLANSTDPATVKRLVAPEATYASLNFDDPKLEKVLPWTGTSTGPDNFVFTFSNVARFWNIEAFEATDVFGSEDKVAVFGSFTYRSVTQGTTVTSPFAILAKVTGGKITYFQFMEDTFATARSFRSGGTWSVQSDPDKAPFEV